MNFGQRLLRYLVGIFLGCVVVYMMFPDRDWLAWTPSRTVIRQINFFPMMVSPEVECRLRCEPRLAAHIIRAKTTGRPVFSRSDTRGVPKRYLISDGRTELTLTIQSDSLITLTAVNPAGECACN
jgi:hypothetical protein